MVSGARICDRGAKNATAWLINNANCGNATRRAVLATSRFETNRIRGRACGILFHFFRKSISLKCGWCLNLQNDCCGVSTESGSDRVTNLEFSILAISGDPVATVLGTDLILKLRHHRSVK